MGGEVWPHRQRQCALQKSNNLWQVGRFRKDERDYSSSQMSALGSSKKDAGRSLSSGTAQSSCEETVCGGRMYPTSGRRGQHIEGTGSSPTLSLARARAQKGEQTPAHGLFSKRHFFAAKAPHVWQNVIPLIENKEWELCGTLPLIKIEYHPGTGTGFKRSSKLYSNYIKKHVNTFTLWRTFEISENEKFEKDTRHPILGNLGNVMKILKRT